VATQSNTTYSFTYTGIDEEALTSSPATVSITIRKR
jgi:hypothetical protein